LRHSCSSLRVHCSFGTAPALGSGGLAGNDRLWLTSVRS
jgi:hypothetical protein